MKNLVLVITVLLSATLTACSPSSSTETKQARQVDAQQEQYAKLQPVPQYDYSIERDLLTQIYNIRNEKVATHSVWRSDYGTVEGDCSSIGFGIPYDTSLTNPLKATDEDGTGFDKSALTTIEQPEPNGIFASKNTNATWVMCAGNNGAIDLVYVDVNYEKNRVVKAGEATATIRIE